MLEKLTGFTSAELIGRKAPYPWWTEETLQKTSKDLEEAMCKGAKRLEELFQKKNGERFWVEITSVPVRRNGEFHYYLAHWEDTTERKQAEDELWESRERFRALTESTSDWIWETDANGVYTYCSPKIKELWGYEPEGLVGKTPFDFMPPEERDRVFEVFQATVESPEPFKRMENTSFDKDGRLIVLEVSGVPFFDADGCLRGFRGISRDITERKQAEETEKRLQQELYLSSRLASIGRLAAGVAHEINNPLTGIIGFSQRLLRKGTDEKVSQDLERIHSEAQRAAKVVENLLTFARHREPKREYSDINDILQKALELRAYELRTSNIEVVTDLAPGLPQIVVDFQQIEEVFLNIILNAEQVMVEAKGRGKLSIKTRQSKDHITISFADSGPGIPAEHLDKLFDPFFTTRGERGGTGLGLSIVSWYCGRAWWQDIRQKQAGEGNHILYRIATDNGTFS